MTRPQDESDRWVVHGERPVYESEWVTVGLADISQPSGDRFDHHTVTLLPAAMTVVLDDAGEHVLLSWRHRFVPDVWNWELPGGLLDYPDETPAQTAAREVEEETGYRARSIEHLVTFEPMVGMVRSPHHVFLSRGAQRVADATELNEGTFEWVALADVPELIAKGRIVNSGTLVGLRDPAPLSLRAGAAGQVGGPSGVQLRLDAVAAGSEGQGQVDAEADLGAPVLALAHGVER